MSLLAASGSLWANPLIEELVDQLENSPARCTQVAPAAAQRQLVEADIATFSKAVPVPEGVSFTVMDCPMDGFVYKGRTIVLSTRLSRLPQAQRVFILAHELAHYHLRHRAVMNTFVAGLVGTMQDQNAARAALSSAAPDFTRISHKAEFDADALAARLMAQAGFDPLEAARLFENIGEGKDNATHPGTGRRARAIRSAHTASVAH